MPVIYRQTGPMCYSNPGTGVDEGTLARVWTPPPVPVCRIGNVPPVEPLDEETRALAAVAYGESSVQDVYEEMAGIACVLVRQQKARGYPSIRTFLSKDKSFAYAAGDGNERHARLKSAREEDIEKDAGMSAAVRAARNALSGSPVDYSNGAWFWDGADIKTNYADHAKVLAGLHITDAAHNIYGIQDSVVAGEEWWRDASGKATKLRGTWKYAYDSTAAHGGTIFWKYNSDYLRATGSKEYR
ncbi:MAG: hypothetical protein RIQ60_2804 [Pseudomonadota bacterium]|jgi:hypothetical protein